MSFKKLLLFIAVMSFQLIYSDAYAQMGYGGPGKYRFLVSQDPLSRARKKPFQRWGAGFNFIPVSGKVAYTTYDQYGNVDSVKDAKIKGWGAGIHYSYEIPIARTGEKTLLAIPIGLNVNFYLYEVDSVAFSEKYFDNSISTVSYAKGAGLNFMFGLPVGLDLLMGGEATLDRANPFSFVVGGGVYPMFTMGGFNESVGAAFRAPGYVKAELGFHKGINWKIRATYLTSSGISFDKDLGSVFDGAASVSSALKAKDQLILSLYVQPFSFKWE